MKKIVLILIAMVMLFSCEEKSKIELVPEIDTIYKSVNLVPKIAMPLDEPLKLPFEEAIKEIHKKENPNEDVIYPIYVRLYISEKGEIDKIKVLRHNLDVISRKRPNPKYDKKIYFYPEKIVKKSLRELQKVKFTPAESEGKKIKMRADVNVIYYVNKNGALKIDKEKMKREHAKSDFDNPVQGIFFVAVEEMPEPIGGIKVIQENILYPEIAKRTGIEGRVYVKAYVDSTGKVVRTEILRGIGGGCDEAAEEAVKKVEFIPGKQRGKRMNVQVTVPILFKLNDSNQKSESKIVGKWEGKADDGEIIKIDFFSHGNADLFKSKSGRFDGKVTPAMFNIKYTVDYSKKPTTLNLLYGEKHIDKLIVKFIDFDAIIIAFPNDLNSRPKNFNKKNLRRTWRLKRIN